MSESGPQKVSGAAAAAYVAVAILAVAAAARVDVPVPGSPVPQSLQTLAVVLVGAWSGPALGALAMLLYAAAGGLGLPVFAGGASGWTHLTGPTAGYLAGFVVGAGLVGWRCSSPSRAALGPAFAASLAAHVLILGAGWTRLAPSVGAGEALSLGVTPFIIGGLAKSAVAAVVIVFVARATISKEGGSHYHTPT